MTLLDAALAEVVKERIESLEKLVEEYEQTLNARLADTPRSRGWFAGKVMAHRNEIRFLTDLHLALTNTMKKPAENPNSALQAEPAA